MKSRTLPIASCFFIGVVCAAGPALFGQPAPLIRISDPVVKIETDGPVGNRFHAFDTADNTTFDLTGAHFAGTPEHPTRVAVTVGNQPVPPTNIRLVGGVYDGGIPVEWNWRLTHGLGGTGVYTVATGLHILEGARIHNFEDGWQPRETPYFMWRAYPNTGSFLMRGCYVTGIRDDAIENDEFMPGDIEDCLFDGVWTFYSEQKERRNGIRRANMVTIGPDEDPDVRITRTLVRLTVTNADEPGPGRWFKLMPYDGAQRHRLVITDSVFATDQMPRRGWRLLNFPDDTVFRGTNHILWLGEPGAYAAEIPDGVMFVEGQAARDMWHRMRNEWLVRHGYDPRGPDDWDPMKAPVVAPRRSR